MRPASSNSKSDNEHNVQAWPASRAVIPISPFSLSLALDSYGLAQGSGGVQLIEPALPLGLLEPMPVDLDHDGDLDVLRAEMEWFENLGGGRFGPAQTIWTPVPAENPVCGG